MTLPNAYGIDSCFNDHNRDICNITAERLGPLLCCCAIDKILAPGINSYQFINFYPLVAEIFMSRGQNPSTNNYLASYCLNGSHGDEAFCQVPETIADATCGTPIVFAVPA
ncbi:unnamed protein product, partial [Ixodes hexagonus]